MAVYLPDEWLSRLRSMVEPGQQTWDLSPRDVVAIQWAITEIDRLRKELADEKASGEVVISAESFAIGQKMLALAMKMPLADWHIPIGGFEDRDG